MFVKQKNVVIDFDPRNFSNMCSKNSDGKWELR